jgi:hypothetical protein
MPKKIPLTQGQFAIVDDEDFNELGKLKWHAQKESKSNYFYAISKRIKMHRAITCAKKGECVDHINHNTLDNRRCNLRLCTIAQNAMNRKLASNNNSGCTGVGWSKLSGEWVARITICKKLIYIGRSKCIFKAACMRKSAENKYFNEFAYNKTKNNQRGQIT